MRRVWVSMPPLNGGIARAMRTARITRGKVRREFRTWLAQDVEVAIDGNVQIVIRRYQYDDCAPRFSPGWNDYDRAVAAYAIGKATGRVLEWLSRLTIAGRYQ